MNTDILAVLTRRDGRVDARLEHDYATDVDDLWDAVTRPDRLARWFAPVDGDLHEGGRYRVRFEGDDPAQTVHGTIVTCRPAELLEVTWEMQDEPDSTVTAVLHRTPGGCRLTITHLGLSQESAAGYGAGWQAYLEALAADRRGEPARGTSWDDRWSELLPAYRDRLAATSA